jgi:hypothetical protein
MAHDPYSPITPPRKFARNDHGRAALKAIVGEIPIFGSAASEIADRVTPDKAAQDRERWEGDVTSRLNHLALASGRPHISHESFAWDLALFANELDTHANAEVQISDADIAVRFPNIPTSELDDALSDLSNANWISCLQNSNSRTGVGGFMTRALLFAYTDPVVRQSSPVDDAKIAADFILSDPDKEAVSSVMLEEHLQWENRRLYPALAFLVSEVLPEASIEANYHPQYPFAWAYLNGNSRRALRQFLAF